jgi:Mg2+-importing ATPase
VRTLITKGALDAVLALCARLRTGVDAARRRGAPAIEQLYSAWSEQGYRVLGVATRAVESQHGPYSRADERDLVFEGFLLFFDPPKAGCAPGD